jgi:hypothetical protein
MKLAVCGAFLLLVASAASATQEDSDVPEAADGGGSGYSGGGSGGYGGGSVGACWPFRFLGWAGASLVPVSADMAAFVASACVEASLGCRGCRARRRSRVARRGTSPASARSRARGPSAWQVSAAAEKCLASRGRSVPTGERTHCPSMRRLGRIEGDRSAWPRLRQSPKATGKSSTTHARRAATVGRSNQLTELGELELRVSREKSGTGSRVELRSPCRPLPTLRGQATGASHPHQHARDVQRRWTRRRSSRVRCPPSAPGNCPSTHASKPCQPDPPCRVAAHATPRDALPLSPAHWLPPAWIRHAAAPGQCCHRSMRAPATAPLRP